MNRYKFKHKLIRYSKRVTLSFFVALVLVIIYHGFSQDIKGYLPGYQSDADYNYSISNSITSDQVLGATTGTGEYKASYGTYNMRARVFDLYFKQNDSPLYGHGQDFIDACRKYNAPEHCSLLPAIAKVETDLCKTDLSASQHNCWGFGGSGENRIIYSNFEEAIDDITGRIMNGYGSRFFNDPNQGELFYCGNHCNSWGERVRSVQLELEEYAKALGYEL